jgi:type I restriction enzyme S subunit
VSGEKTRLVPKLRFPEFRGAEWVQKKLEDVAPLQRGFDLPSDLIRPGNIPIVYSNGIQKYHEIGMATAPGLVTGRSGTIGKLHFIEHGEYWPHNTSLWVTDFKSHVPRFVYYLYASIGMGQFSSGSGVPTLNRNDVHAFSSAVPISLTEQQKIADCLNSLDELIAAQARKIEALKTHKKGLTQQLFPIEGETQPRLRFPEFQDTGEWEEGSFGAAATFLNGRAYSQEELLESGKYRVLRVGNFFSNKSWYYSDLELEENKYCDDGDLLYAWSASFGPRIWCGEKVVYHYHIWKVLPFDGVDKKFLFILLDYETEKMKSQSANGLGLMHITKGIIESWECYIPKPDEQQRIAACLTSLDDLITATTQELDTLKTHKKGLMQQLFPSVEGVEA